MNRNGFALPNVAPQQTSLQVASPINDVQLVALIAGQIMAHQSGMTPAKAAELANEVVFEAILAGPALLQKLQAYQRKKIEDARTQE